jgi:hypothetical protein
VLRALAPTTRRVVPALLALCLTVAAGGLAASRARAYVFRVGVARSTVTRPLAGNFLGLALEYNEIPPLARATPQSVNPLFVALLRNLDPAGGAIIRVGGLSTDRTWWPVPGMSRPLGITYTLTPAWTTSALTLAKAAGVRYLLGVNLEANRTRIDQVEGAQLVNRIGRRYIDALEIGNEPDIYTLIPWYKRANGDPLPWYDRTGTPVFSRGPAYGPAQFIQEFGRALKVVPRLPIAGPETGTPPWMDAFDTLLSPHSQVRMLTVHAYGLNQCVTDPTSPAYPSVPNLLSTVASRGDVSGIAPYVGIAHRNGAALRVDEMGSISCNGRAGVSNTMASALWLLDSLFQIDADGVDGVNLHTYPHSVNGLFDFAHTRGVWSAAVHPIYYGALMFAQAAPPGSRLLTLSSAAQTRFRAWATLGADHRIRVLLINDSLRGSALALVHTPVAPGPASVERLRATSAYATGGLTLGGQTFGAATATGILAAPVPQTARPSGGTYRVTLPAGSAALLTLPPGV